MFCRDYKGVGLVLLKMKLMINDRSRYGADCITFPRIVKSQKSGSVCVKLLQDNINIENAGGQK